MEATESVLWVAHTEAPGALAKGAMEALAAAIRLADGGARLVVGVFGAGAAAAIERIGGCGAQRFLMADGPALEQPRYATDAAAVAALASASGASLVVAPETSRLSRALPGAAQRCGGRVDTRVTAMARTPAGVEIERWFYRQRLVARLTRTHRPWFLLSAGGAEAPWPESPRQGVPVERVEVQAASRTEVVGTEAPAASSQAIRPDADLLLVAGAGWTKQQADGRTHVAEAEALILDFLAKTQASLGSSKSLVDQGSEGQPVLSFLSHLNQIGQTGSTPRHPRGLATCCHGEEPHVVGWRFINERRAINLDPNCGWAQGKADVLYVADAFAVLRRVNELLDQAEPARAVR